MYGPYKSHFACFTCHKAFKQPPIGDFFAAQGQKRNIHAELAKLWSAGDRSELQRRERQLNTRLDELEAEYRTSVRKCPECGEPMVDMGLDFKPPRKSDAKAWQILKGMYATGHAFHTCGCDGPGWIPKSSSDYKQYLETHKLNYAKQLRGVQVREDLTSERKHEAAEYWTSRIESIDEELRKLR